MTAICDTCGQAVEVVAGEETPTLRVVDRLAVHEGISSSRCEGSGMPVERHQISRHGS